MKRSVVACLLFAFVLFLYPMPAAAATCTPTGFYRDGINMTAAQINPVSLTGDLDATGCNIGVYFDSSGTVNGAKIHGATYFGVLVNGDINTVSVDISNSTLYNIGETPFNGTQHGVAIYYRALGTGTARGNVTGNNVYAYQKGGITVNGAGATVSVTNNTVTGLGMVNFIAQNGIQFGYGANGVASGNAISGNFYTGTVGVGPNPGGQNPPGWQYVSGGLLLYQPGDLKTFGNFYSNNQRNVLMVP